LQQQRGHTICLRQARIYLTAAIQNKAWSLMQKMTVPKYVNLQSVLDEITQLLDLTIEAAAQQMQPAKWLPRRKLIDYRLRLAMTHMEENLVQPSVINPIAKRVGVSRSRLYELFQDELATTPKLIWSSMRLKCAIHLMMTTQVDLATIAAQLGFSSAGNFSRFFRSITGMSPLAYRRKNVAKHAHIPQLTRSQMSVAQPE
jgi:transcriptional regulator GlxA family with amidase domain